MDQVFETQIRALSATLAPSTVDNCYRVTVRRFLRYLRDAHPNVRTLGQLHRDPHLLGCLAHLGQEKLSNKSRTIYLQCLRRLFEDLADNGHRVRNALILPQDFPPRDVYLPRPLTPEVDRLFQEELRRADDLISNAFLLLRFTGMRIRECLRLSKDALRCLGGNDWALHVPLGKLHTERWVPVDEDTRKIFARIRSLSGVAPPGATDPPDPLLVTANGRQVSYGMMRAALLLTAQRIGCTRITAHQLRHTYATTMVRAGISLAALRKILGHRDVSMTLCYVDVTQNDLQHEYRAAQKLILAGTHSVPRNLALPIRETSSTRPAVIIDGLTALQHHLEMFRRQTQDERAKRTLRRLVKRLTSIRAAVAGLSHAAE